jgi:predicted acylesterase/phospholipase RssA
MISFTEGC